jgi:hypothetical protein
VPSPLTVRATIKRPLKLINGKKTPPVVIDGVNWHLSKTGYYLIDRPEFRDKDVRIPIEALAYIRPLFRNSGIEIPVHHDPVVTFSSDPKRGDVRRVYYSVGKASNRVWFYMTRQGFVLLARHLMANAPRAYKTLRRIVPASDYPLTDVEE